MKKLLSMVLLLVILSSFTISYAEITAYETPLNLNLLVDKDKTDVYLVDVSLENPLFKYVTSFNSIEFSTGIPEEKLIEIMKKAFNMQYDKKGYIEVDEAKTKFKTFYFHSTFWESFSFRSTMSSDTTVEFSSFRIRMIKMFKLPSEKVFYGQSEEPWVSFEDILKKYSDSERVFLIDIYGNESDPDAEFREVSLGIVNTSEKVLEFFIPMYESTFRQNPRPLRIQNFFKSVLCDGRTPIKDVGELTPSTDEYAVISLKEKKGTKEVRIYYADDGSICFDAMLEALMEVINSYGGITPVKGDLHGNFEQVIGELAQDVKVNTPR